MEHPEIVLTALGTLYLTVKGKLNAALTLAFAGAVCYANFYMLEERLYFTAPLAYTITFAVISAVVLVLLVYQLIQTT